MVLEVDARGAVVSAEGAAERFTARLHVGHEHVALLLLQRHVGVALIAPLRHRRRTSGGRRRRPLLVVVVAQNSLLLALRLNWENRVTTE